jgi:hypothetical protein
MIMSANTMGVVNTVFDASSILRKSYLGRASPAKPVSRSHFHAYDSKCEKVVSIVVYTFHLKRTKGPLMVLLLINSQQIMCTHVSTHVRSHSQD